MRYLALTLALSVALFAQGTKPRIFVHAKGTVNAMSQGSGAGGFFNRGVFASSRTDSVVDEHDEAIELSKELRQQCDGVTVTLKEDAADYIVMLNRESKAKKGLFSKNNQVLVADRNGDVIWTKDVRAVASAAKDVCAAVTSRGFGSPNPPAAATSNTAAPLPAPSQQPTTAAPAPQNLKTETPPAMASAPPTPQTNQGNTALLGLVVRNWDQGGVQIVAITPDGAAESAGLHVGDVIDSLNGKRIKSEGELAAALSGKPVGSKVVVGYMFRSNLGFMPGTDKVLVLKP
ncbi:MAG TPA: PDZ domain-containing protein [Terriglobales bacterium]|jgi:PDZ domain|nr:PDZ domain-containing protein [Terriglobales bacterium]